MAYLGRDNIAAAAATAAVAGVVVVVLLDAAVPSTIDVAEFSTNGT
jgi:hypothetical protein